MKIAEALMRIVLAFEPKHHPVYSLIAILLIGAMIIAVLSIPAFVGGNAARGVVGGTVVATGVAKLSRRAPTRD